MITRIASSELAQRDRSRMRASRQVSPPPAPLPPQIRPAPPPRQKRAFKCVPILLWVWFLKVDPVLTRSPGASGWAGRAGPGPPSPPRPERGEGRLGRTVPRCPGRAVRRGARRGGWIRGPGTEGRLRARVRGRALHCPPGADRGRRFPGGWHGPAPPPPLSVRLPRQEMSSYWKDSCCLLPRVVESETNSTSPGRQKTLCSSWGVFSLNERLKKATCQVPAPK